MRFKYVSNAISSAVIPLKILWSGGYHYLPRVINDIGDTYGNTYFQLKQFLFFGKYVFFIQNDTFTAFVLSKTGDPKKTTTLFKRDIMYNEAYFEHGILGGGSGTLWQKQRESFKDWFQYDIKSLFIKIKPICQKYINMWTSRNINNNDHDNKARNKNINLMIEILCLILELRFELFFNLSFEDETRKLGISKKEWCVKYYQSLKDIIYPIDQQNKQFIHQYFNPLIITNKPNNNNNDSKISLTIFSIISDM